MVSESILFGALLVSNKQNTSVTCVVRRHSVSRVRTELPESKLWPCPLLLLTLTSYLSGSWFLLSVLRAPAWPFPSKQKRFQTFRLSKGHLMQSRDFPGLL